MDLSNWGFDMGFVCDFPEATRIHKIRVHVVYYLNLVYFTSTMVLNGQIGEKGAIG